MSNNHFYLNITKIYLLSSGTLLNIIGNNGMHRYNILLFRVYRSVNKISMGEQTDLVAINSYASAVPVGVLGVLPGSLVVHNVVRAR